MDVDGEYNDTSSYTGEQCCKVCVCVCVLLLMAMDVMVVVSVDSGLDE